MKIATKNNKPKVLIAIIAAVILLGAIGVYAYAQVSKSQPANNAATTTPTSQQQSGEVNYDTPSSEQQSAGSTTKDKATSQNDSDNSGGSVIKVTLQGGSPKLNALLDVVTNAGTCTLTLTGPSTVTLTSDIQAQSSYSVCKGFDTSTLAAGNWTATVDVQSDGKKGSATQTFTVQ